MNLRRIDIIILATVIILCSQTAKVYEEKICVTPELAGNSNVIKQVALTFDDGPHPEYTQKIVDILSQYRIKATFFLVGKQVKKYPELVEYIVKNSCSKIANHTYTHRNLTKLNNEEVYFELFTTQKLLLNIAGEKYKDRILPYFRPPGGHYNYEIVSIAEKMNLKILLWTVFTNDHSKQITKEQLLNKILKSTSGEKEIILLHSGSNVTLESLPQIIQLLKDKNYIFVTVDEIMNNEETFTGS